MSSHTGVKSDEISVEYAAKLIKSSKLKIIFVVPENSDVLEIRSQVNE